MKVMIENDYSDGHSSVTSVDIPDECYTGNEEELWDEVWPHTGDGHGRYAAGTRYGAIILESAHAELIGLTYEWIG